MASMTVGGEVVDDVAVAGDYEGLRRHRTERVLIAPSLPREEVEMVSFEASNILVTSYHVPIDVERGRLFANQTYTNAAQWVPGERPVIADGRFTIESKPIRLPGRYVVVGGPIDGVWYHWMVSWCARITLLKKLRPDLFADESVRFLVDGRAAADPFAAVLAAVGCPLDRVTFSYHARDYLLERAVLVSFPDQRYLYSDIVRELAADVKRSFDIPPDASQTGRVYTSREHFTYPKRRLANFSEVEPVLKANGFEIVSMGALSGPTQVKLFHEAEIVLGSHGSDLTSVLFCRPGAQVIVVENERNVKSGIGASLTELARIAGAQYRCVVVEEEVRSDIDYGLFQNVHNRDLILPPHVLRAALAEAGASPVY